MSVPFPHIPENETVTELLDVFLNPAKFKERLEAQKAWYEQITRMLNRFKEWGEIEDARNLAASLVVQAKKDLEDAAKFVREEKFKCDEYHRKTVEEADMILRKAKEKEAFFDKLESMLQAREAKLTELQTKTEAKEKEAEQELTQALAAKGRAETAERIYNSKIAKIQEISTGD